MTRHARKNTYTAATEGHQVTRPLAEELLKVLHKDIPDYCVSDLVECVARDNFLPWRGRNIVPLIFLDFVQILSKVDLMRFKPLCLFDEFPSKE